METTECIRVTVQGKSNTARYTLWLSSPRILNAFHGVYDVRYTTGYVMKTPMIYFKTLQSRKAAITIRLADITLCRLAGFDASTETYSAALNTLRKEFRTRFFTVEHLKPLHDSFDLEKPSGAWLSLTKDLWEKGATGLDLIGERVWPIFDREIGQYLAAGGTFKPELRKTVNANAVAVATSKTSREGPALFNNPPPVAQALRRYVDPYSVANILRSKSPEMVP